MLITFRLTDIGSRISVVSAPLIIAKKNDWIVMYLFIYHNKFFHLKLKNGPIKPEKYAKKNLKITIKL